MSRLPKAPLQEVIFEIRWPLMPGKIFGHMIDEGFELASGRLSTIINEHFPVYKRVIIQEIPVQSMNYQVVHQYWTGENKWPVMQLGPGIFTINCTDDAYYWQEFQQLIGNGIKWLEQAYGKTLNIQFASLRYIDAITVDDYGGVEDGWQNFIRNHFNIEYINHFDPKGQQKKIQINQTFKLDDDSDLQIQIADGLRNNKKALIWETAILKKQSFSTEDLLLWTDFAHGITHDLFKEMIKPNLYASFSRTN